MQLFIPIECAWISFCFNKFKTKWVEKILYSIFLMQMLCWLSNTEAKLLLDVDENRRTKKIVNNQMTNWMKYVYAIVCVRRTNPNMIWITLNILIIQCWNDRAKKTDVLLSNLLWNGEIHWACKYFESIYYCCHKT